MADYLKGEKMNARELIAIRKAIRRIKDSDRADGNTKRAMCALESFAEALFFRRYGYDALRVQVEGFSRQWADRVSE
jgi:hypothetical protein